MQVERLHGSGASVEAKKKIQGELPSRSQGRMTSDYDSDRTKDGVPVWNGEASTFQSYEERALQWEQGVQWNKRYLCGPRLVSELTGTARKLIVGKRPDWLSFNGGVQYLLEHLRVSLGRPQISDMTDHLNRYFKSTKRKKMESMNDYITRKTEAYERARQALVRVERQYGKEHRRDDWTQWYGSSYSGHHRWSDSWTSWDQQQEGNDEGTHPQGEGDGGDDEEEEFHEAEDERSSQGRGSSWYQWGSHTGSYQSRPTVEDEAWKRDSRELLPDFLQGWYLLQDASLDASEKNMIQTAIQGNFGLQNVAQELRAQWTEEDLRKRDQGGRQAGLWQEEVQLGEDLEGEDRQAYFYDDLVKEGMTDEGLGLMCDAEENVERAYAMVEQARRTLREAREKQKSVKMSRQYYKTQTWKPRSWDKGGKGGKGFGNKCLRCGGAHRTGACPDKPAGSGQFNEEESAPFVCYTEEEEKNEEAMASFGNNKSTQDAINEGMGIIDGGATRTLASVHALEKLMEVNQKKYGNNGVQEVNTKEQVTFGFGNSSKDKCISTAKVEISANQKPGLLQVHALDKGTGPILISVETLRSLGAVIDFQADLVAFRNLDKYKVVPLERSSSGHQLLPLSEDLYSKARNCKTAVPSLADLC